MNRQTLTLPLAGFLVVLGIGLFFASIQNRYWSLEQSKQLNELALTQATLLERRLSRSLSAAQTVAAVIHTQGEIQDFDALADDLIQTIGVISNLQLAPDGVVRQIYPLTGNEAALGHDILKDDARKSDAFIAIASRQMTVSGPYQLIQGGIALVGRQPIYLHNEQIASEKFWGFASVLIHINDLMTSADLDGLFNHDVLFQIWRYHPQTGTREVLFGEGEPNKQAATAKVSVYNLDWHLTVWPRSASSNPFLPVHVLLVLMAAGLAAYLLYFLVRQPMVLNQLVAEKTRLLEIANLQLKENERHLLRQAHHDPLTGLPNRLLFNDRLQGAILRAEREGNRFALLLIDLDDFKPVNDRWGHAAGDEILIQVGRRLQSCARRSDTVARIGGDEFVMLLTTISDANNAQAMANKIRDSLTRAFTIPQGRAEIDCSIGVAVFPDHGTDADTVLSHADNAMYAVKHSGRGGSSIYASSEPV